MEYALCRNGGKKFSVNKIYRKAEAILKIQVISMIIATALISVVFLETNAAEVAKPNLIVILTDDQGYADVGCYGATNFVTPNLDQMAKEGVRFTSFYAAPWCSPARASLMTGAHYHRLGIVGPLNGPRIGLHPDEITLAEHLKDQGYSTALIGKWHLGLPDSMSPIAQGFDYFSGLPLSHIRHTETEHTDGPTAYYRRQWRQMIPGEKDVVEFDPDDKLFTKRITNESIKFIRAREDKPFFLYLSHAQVHREVLASEEFIGKSKFGVWGDAVQELDWSVGQVLGELQNLGIDQNTLVIFMSDNGPSPNEKGSARPLSGKKGSTLEGGSRVPCIMRWPGEIPPGIESDEVVSIMDIFPTFAKRIGTQMPGDRITDGKDIWPLMSGVQGARTPHNAYFYASNKGLEAVRSGPWKLHVSHSKPKLFNLDSDIGERRDVSKNHPDVVQKLQALIDKARIEIGGKAGHGTQSRPLGQVSVEEGVLVSRKFRGLTISNDEDE